MRRSLLILALSAGAFGAAGWPVRPAAADPVGADRGVRWEVVSARADYRAGEPVRLIGTVTNLAGEACGLADLADGTVQVLGLTRDGQRLSPRFARAAYVDGLDTAVAARLRVVPAGGRLTVLAGAGRVGGELFLRVVEPLPDGDGLVALWPVGAPGRYEVTLSYLVPQVSGPPAHPATDPAADPRRRPCHGAAAPVTVAFTIGRPQPAHAWRPPAAIAAGLLALLLVLAALRVHRPSLPGRRSWAGRRSRGGGAGMVVLLVAGGVVGVGARPARAAYEVDGADPGFAARVEACLREFARPGADPARVLDLLADPRLPVVRIGPTDGETAVVSTGLSTVEPAAAAVDWNPRDSGWYADGVAREPCAALYHALVDAGRFARGGGPVGACGAVGMPAAQVDSTGAENGYRLAVGLPPRTGYRGRPVPPDQAPCRQPALPPQARLCTAAAGTAVGAAGTGAGSRAGRAACARDGGDPHLTTFDQYAYDLQAVGEFVLAGGVPGFAVQARQVPMPGSRTVSLTTAIAARVGADRVVFTLRGGEIRVRVNGVPVTGAAALSGGGRLARRDSGIGFGPYGYALAWPDGSAAEVDAVSAWSLRLYLKPAPALAGRPRGLLGDFDGDPADDLAARTGAVLAHAEGERPRFEQLYPAFADQWRVRPAESLFDYPPGTDPRAGTAAATDRGFPDGPAGAELSAGPRARAEALCLLAGVSDRWLLADCAQDVSLSGQPAFAVAAADTERTAPGPGAGSRGVPVLGTLRDGDLIGPDQPFPGAGWLAGASERDRYDLALPPGQEFQLYQVRGGPGVRVDLVGPDGRAVPGGNALPLAYGFRVPARAGPYRLQVTAGPGGGSYGFRLVTLKPRRYELSLGEHLHARLDLPGRVDAYALDTAGLATITLAGMAGSCRRVWIGLAEDGAAPRAGTAVQPCLPVTLPIPHPGRQYVVLIWSGDGAPAYYALTVTAR